METGGRDHEPPCARRSSARCGVRSTRPDVLPRLARLARLAPAASDDGVFAHRQLAELLVERHPWRAAIYARRALAHRADDDRAWAVLAFCQTLLGNFRCAATAYKNAIASAPANPWYAHNLGHLLDVALGAPDRASAVAALGVWREGRQLGDRRILRARPRTRRSHGRSAWGARARPRALRLARARGLAAVARSGRAITLRGREPRRQGRRRPSATLDAARGQA